MLVVLMYHRVALPHIPLRDNAFANHLSWLARNYHIVVPGDKLDKNRINICLTFDDAYFDFYHTVFPLLQTFNIPAVLAIPAGFILENTTIPDENRLEAPCLEAESTGETHGNLCTWEEIRHMVQSGLVVPASHGLTHQCITSSNLEQEVLYAKTLLEEKTGMSVNTFIYPFGKSSRSINRFIRQHYQYTMRIGSALNVGWNNMHNLIYRVNADQFWPQGKPMLTPGHQLAMWSRFISNTVRFK